MIRVALEKDSRGVIRELRTSGHGYTYQGVSISCAIITAGVKNFARTMVLRKTLEVSGSSFGPGDLVFRVGSYPLEDVRWILGVQDLFETIVNDAVSSFPQEVSIQESVMRGENNGT